MAMSRWSVNLTTLFRGRLRLGSTFCTRFRLWLTISLLESLKDNRNYFMINLHEGMGPGSNSRSLYEQLHSLPIALQGQVILGFLFYLNWPWIYKFSFRPIWLFWSHTIWIIDCLVYQSGAYEAFTGDLVNKGKWHLFQGNRGRNAKFWREQRQYWGTGNIRKQNLREQRNKPIYFRGTTKHVPPPPPPERASHIT